ncbi:MAG: polysaccharide deacetylase family protein [Oscillospiraceae bacterium]|nr:polysaccharide deacetylase family protein [Oscillospiraceae bacterium]
MVILVCAAAAMLAAALIFALKERTEQDSAVSRGNLSASEEPGAAGEQEAIESAAEAPDGPEDGENGQGKTDLRPDPSKPMAALTFDDGPSAAATHLVLDVLEEYQVSATFFLLGRNISEDVYGDVQRMAALGCQVESHSWSHRRLTELTAEEIQEEVEKTSDAIYAAAGIRPTLLRPPFGSYNDEVKAAAGVPLFCWSVDTRDWESKDPEAILAAVQENAFDGCVILMHDIYDTTAQACQQVVPWLLEQGYQLVTVSQLMEARGVVLEAGGAVYGSAKP